MNKYEKPKIDESTFGVNPFSYSLVIPVRDMEFEGHYKKDEDGDLLPASKSVDLTAHTKVYLSSERRLIKSNLSLRAKEMFLWVCDELEAGKDYIWINKQRYMEENHIKSVNTFKDALEEMIRYGFLAISTIKNVYWINPDFLFRGDRVKKYNKNLKKD